MAIRLIALDIDDAVVDSNNKISPANESAIKSALNHGIRIALVTEAS